MQFQHQKLERSRQLEKIVMIIRIIKLIFLGLEINTFPDDHIVTRPTVTHMFMNAKYQFVSFTYDNICSCTYIILARIG